MMKYLPITGHHIWRRLEKHLKIAKCLVIIGFSYTSTCSLCNCRDNTVIAPQIIKYSVPGIYSRAFRIVGGRGSGINGPVSMRRRYPGRLTAPSCNKRPSTSMTCQCSTHLPSATRMMSMMSLSTLLPVGAMPMKSPWWVPCRVL